MGYESIFDGIIEEKLMNLHTAYVAKVLSVNGKTAKIQPLNMIKQYGKNAQKQSPVTAYILNNARYKLKFTTVSDSEVLTGIPISAGDIVFCVCAERDITEAKKGILATPVVGRHHSSSDSVIVGIL